MSSTSRRFVRVVLLAAAASAACAAPRPSNPSSHPPSHEDLVGQIKAAARDRDRAALEKLRPLARGDATARAELARALYWIGGVPAARDEVIAVCHDTRLVPESKERTNACATAAFAELSAGKPLNRLRTAGAGPFLDGQKLFIAMVSLDGNPPEPFIVDTGAPTTVISKRYAERVHLAYRTDVAALASDAAGNRVELRPALVGLVKWGDIEVENAPAHVLELPESFKVGGILSPQDLLRDAAFEVDGPRRVLRIVAEPDPRADRSAALLWEGGNFYVEARANDLPPLPFLLDSGAGANGVCEETLRAAGRSLDGGDVAASATAGGAAAVRTGIEGTLSVADEPQQATSLFMQACPREEGSAVVKAGYVGAPWFWERRVIFARDRRRVTFFKPAATASSR